MQAHSPGLNLTGGDTVQAGSGAQAHHVLVGGRDHHGVLARRHVVPPGRVDVLGHGFTGAARGARGVDVEVQAVLVALAQQQRGLGLPGGGEAVHLFQVGGADLVVDQAQHATGADRRELRRVPQQAHARTVFPGQGQHPIQLGGAGHPGLVHQQDRALIDDQALRYQAAVVCVQQLVDRVGSDAELVAQN